MSEILSHYSPHCAKCRDAVGRPRAGVPDEDLCLFHLRLALAEATRARDEARAERDTALLTVRALTTAANYCLEYKPLLIKAKAERDAALAALSRARETPAGPAECTGVAASWCPVHGDCTCPRRKDGSWTYRSHKSCPLHSEESNHGDAEVAAVEADPRARETEDGAVREAAEIVCERLAGVGGAYYREIAPGLMDDIDALRAALSSTPRPAPKADDDCPDCHGVGFYASGPTDAPVQTQCPCWSPAPLADAATDEVREAAEGRNVYRLGVGPLGTIHCAVATSPDEPGVALVIHEVTPEESSEIDTGNHRFRGRETPSLRHVTEVWFQRPESVHAVIHALEDVLAALDARGGAE